MKGCKIGLRFLGALKQRFNQRGRLQSGDFLASLDDNPEHRKVTVHESSHIQVVLCLCQGQRPQHGESDGLLVIEKTVTLTG